MSVRPARSRYGLAGGGRYKAPRFRGDVTYEIARAWTRATRPGVAVAFVLVAGGLIWEVLAPTPVSAGPSLLLVLMGFPVGALVGWLNARRAVGPAADLVLWSVDSNLRLWRELDGGDPPWTPDEGLARLADRTGDLAAFLLLGTLLEMAVRHDRIDRPAIATELDRWHPADPVAVARRARMEAAVAYLDGVDDVTAARAATVAIPDAVVRADQTAALAFEEARRLVIASKDPLPPLLAAREGLGTIDLTLVRPFLPSRRQRVVRFGIILVGGTGAMCAFWIVLAVVWPR